MFPDARLAATDVSNAEKEKAPMGGAGLPGDMGAAANIPKPAPKKKNFLDSWLEKKAKLEKKSREEAVEAMNGNKAVASKGLLKKKAPAPKPKAVP